MTQQLRLEEWDKFRKVFVKNFPDPPPSPTEAVVVVEKDGEEIIGFMTVRYVPVMTVWVDERHRAGGRVLESLFEKIRTLTKAAQLFAFTKDERLARMYRAFGGGKDEGVALSWRNHE